MSISNGRMTGTFKEDFEMASVSCLHCHKPVPDSETSCSHCGASIRPVANYCPNCNKTLPSSQEYCRDCGTKSVPAKAGTAIKGGTLKMDYADPFIRNEHISSDPLELAQEQVRLLRNISGSLTFFKVLAIISLVVGAIALIAVSVGLPS
jgi:RNA polymerase subunit RPABC4/transcription elongation factor Spt4